VPLMPCLVCGRLSKGSRCPRHRVVGWRERPSPSSRDRLPPGERAKVRAERGDVCEACGLPGTADDPLEVHHERAVSEGGTHSRGNLRVLHASCHKREHRRRKR
jgi:5-methylcytosine-specific restriction endonuclease McrA